MANLIRTVMIAGIEGPEGQNNIARFLTKHFLQFIHVNDDKWKTRELPMCDAAIMVIGGVSHGLTDRAIEHCKANNIRVYMAQGGMSSIRKEFLDDVYGQNVLHTLKSGDLVNTAKLNWILARFFKIGQTIKLSNYNDAVVNVLGLESAYFRNYIGQSKVNGVIGDAGYGKFVFLGIPIHYKKHYDRCSIPYQEDWFSSGVTEPKPVSEHPLAVEDTVAVDTVPVVQNDVLKKLDDDTRGAIDLLMEAQSKQLEEMHKLKQIIPQIIAHEIRGITRLLGNIVPELQGLAPDELDKVQQMIKLMTGMRGKHHNGETRNHQ